MSKSKKKSAVDSTIERYLKKNRIFSKTEQLKISDIYDQFGYFLTLLDDLNDSVKIKYVIIQYGVQESHDERFLYTDNNYTIIITDDDMFNCIRTIDYNIYETLHISILSDKGFEILKEV